MRFHTALHLPVRPQCRRRKQALSGDLKGSNDVTGWSGLCQVRETLPHTDLNNLSSYRVRQESTKVGQKY